MKDVRECIIFEDNDICVCHKPAGVLTQADRGFSQDMVSALMAYERKKGNQKPFIAPVNRLDRPVEGLVLYAKNSRAAAALTGQLMQHGVDKYYYAVVDGAAGEEKKAAEQGGAEGSDIEAGTQNRKMTVLEDYLLKDSRTNTSQVVPCGTPGAKKAVLEYELLKSSDGKGLLRIRLRTGRHHQIRVQLSHAGMPIVGDAKYGSGAANMQKEGSVQARSGGWPALCSYRLEFEHPATGMHLCYEVKPAGKGFTGFFTDRDEHE